MPVASKWANGVISVGGVFSHLLASSDREKAKPIVVLFTVRFHFSLAVLHCFENVSQPNQ